MSPETERQERREKRRKKAKKETKKERKGKKETLGKDNDQRNRMTTFLIPARLQRKC